MLLTVAGLLHFLWIPLALQEPQRQLLSRKWQTISLQCVEKLAKVLTMDKILPVLFISIVWGFLLWSWFLVAKRNTAEKNWNAIQKSKIQRWLFRFTSREKYIKQQKIAARFVMPFLTLTWICAMWLIITTSIPFRNGGY